MEAEKHLGPLVFIKLQMIILSFVNNQIKPRIKIVCFQEFFFPHQKLGVAGFKMFFNESVEGKFNRENDQLQ